MQQNRIVGMGMNREMTRSTTDSSSIQEILGAKPGMALEEK